MCSLKHVAPAQADPPALSFLTATAPTFLCWYCILHICYVNLFSFDSGCVSRTFSASREKLVKSWENLCEFIFGSRAFSLSYSPHGVLCHNQLHWSLIKTVFPRNGSSGNTFSRSEIQVCHFHACHVHTASSPSLHSYKSGKLCVLLHSSFFQFRVWISY